MLVADSVGVAGAAWAVKVAATRVATRISSVEVTACVGTRDGSIVFVGTEVRLQLDNNNAMSRKKQICDFIDKLHLSEPLTQLHCDKFPAPVLFLLANIYWIAKYPCPSLAKVFDGNFHTINACLGSDVGDQNFVTPCFYSFTIPQQTTLDRASAG